MVMPQGTLYDYHDGKRRASTRRSPPVREEGKEARAPCTLATRKRDEKKKGKHARAVESEASEEEDVDEWGLR